MPYRKQHFENEQTYHVILRAIDNNLLFKDENDYYRGIFSIYEFNNANPVTIQKRREERARFKKSRERVSTTEVDKRERLVDVLAFCLMPNHLHLLLKQIKDYGITKFMMKVGAGFGGYFNRKYHRKGHVFQNRFVDVWIDGLDHFKTIFVYIHTNPVALIEPKWKELGVLDSERAIEFIESYKWSSYQDYLGKYNFPSVTQRDFLDDLIGAGSYSMLVNAWINEKKKLRQMFSFLEKIKVAQNRERVST